MSDGLEIPKSDLSTKMNKAIDIINIQKKPFLIKYCTVKNLKATGTTSELRSRLSRYIKGTLILDDINDTLSEIECQLVLNESNANKIDFKKLQIEAGLSDCSPEPEQNNKGTPDNFLNTIKDNLEIYENLNNSVNTYVDKIDTTLENSNTICNNSQKEITDIFNSTLIKLDTPITHNPIYEEINLYDNNKNNSHTITQNTKMNTHHKTMIIKPDTFSGQSDVKQFIKQYEIAGEINNWDDENKIDYSDYEGRNNTSRQYNRDKSPYPGKTNYNRESSLHRQYDRNSRDRNEYNRRSREFDRERNYRQSPKHNEDHDRDGSFDRSGNYNRNRDRGNYNKQRRENSRDRNERSRTPENCQREYYGRDTNDRCYICNEKGHYANCCTNSKKLTNDELRNKFGQSTRKYEYFKNQNCITKAKEIKKDQNDFEHKNKNDDTPLKEKIVDILCNKNASAIINTYNTTHTIQPLTNFQEFFFNNDSHSKIIDNYHELEGDIFLTDTNTAIGHCVSKCFTMSKGIGLQFRQKFSNIDKLINQNKRVKEIAHLQYNNKWILYLITKNKFNEKPTYPNIFETLINTKQFCLDKDITTLALPKIHSGLDGMKWNIISTMIKCVFQDTPIKILIFCKEQGNETSYNNLKLEEKKNYLYNNDGLKNQNDELDINFQCFDEQFENYDDKNKSHRLDQERKHRVLSIVVILDDKKIHAIIDTGSNLTCIDYSVITCKNVIKPKDNIMIIGPDKNELEQIGKTDFNMKINDINYFVKGAYVIKGLQCKLLLGNKFHIENELIINFKDKSLILNNNNIIQMDEVWYDYNKTYN